MFVIPPATIREIEKILRGFLWCSGELKQGKAKMNWKMVCRPKINGRLGIKNLKIWNFALLSKQVWNVINKKSTLWVIGFRRII